MAQDFQDNYLYMRILSTNSRIRVNFAALVVLSGVAGSVILLLSVLRPLREESRYMQCRGRLKQIGLALLNYHQEYGAFPPLAVSGEHENLQHSWRALILPFLGYEDLYAGYHFEEPWNSSKNSEFSRRSVNPFSCASDFGVNPQWTSYVAVASSWTIKPEMQNNSGAEDRPAPPKILVIEMRDCGIHWTEPREPTVTELLAYLRKPPRQRHPKGINFVTVDDTVGSIEPNIGIAELKAMLGVSEVPGEYF